MRRRGGAKSIHRPAGARTKPPTASSSPSLARCWPWTSPSRSDVTLSGPYARLCAEIPRRPRSAHRQDRLGRYRGRRRPARRQGMPRRARPGRAFAHVSCPMPRPTTNFARLQADKNDMTVLALEDAAREAANTIFSLRKAPYRADSRAKPAKTSSARD